MTKTRLPRKIKQRYYKNQICLEKIEDSYKKSILLRKN